ncbi:MAG: hypothetical protein LBP76_13330 [Treponema sp.]|jgi:hypothetical protein|nr:hypothetical protein [Treponema sp.]
MEESIGNNRQNSAVYAREIPGNLDDKRVTWHTAFIDAIRLSLINYQDALDFDIEYQLTREPLRIDLIIIKKKQDVIIDKNIASIFKGKNIVEFKGPDHSLSVEDFHTVMAYAHLYCTPPGNADMGDLSVSFVCSHEPRDMKAYLRDFYHYRLTEKWPGITLIEGGVMPMQIVERNKLSAREEPWLVNLDRNLNAERVKAVLEDVQKIGTSVSFGAYLYMVVLANAEMVREVMKMNDLAVFEEVFKGFGIIEKYKDEGIAEGMAKGITEGEAKGIVKGIAKGIAKGITEGIAKGITEGEAKGKEKKALEIAQTMKADKEPIDKIARYTGLTEQQIAALP